MSTAPIFRRVALIGFGLIGGSIARAARAQGLAGDRSVALAARIAAKSLTLLDLGAGIGADVIELARGSLTLR